MNIPPAQSLAAVWMAGKGMGEAGIQAGALALQKARLVCSSWMAEGQCCTEMPLELLVLRKLAKLNHPTTSIQGSSFTLDKASLFCSQNRGRGRHLMPFTISEGKRDRADPQGKEHLPQNGVSLLV